MLLKTWFKIGEVRMSRASALAVLSELARNHSYNFGALYVDHDGSRNDGGVQATDVLPGFLLLEALDLTRAEIIERTNELTLEIRRLAQNDSATANPNVWINQDIRIMIPRHHNSDADLPEVVGSAQNLIFIDVSGASDANQVLWALGFSNIQEETGWRFETVFESLMRPAATETVLEEVTFVCVEAFDSSVDVSQAITVLEDAFNDDASPPAASTQVVVRPFRLNGSQGLVRPPSPSTESGSSGPDNAGFAIMTIEEVDENEAEQVPNS